MSENPKVFYRHRNADLCRLDSGDLRGLRHRTVVDGRTGSRALALWQEEHAPRFVVPPHRHDCEEIITVLAGEIEAQIEERSYRVRPEESILIGEWALHGFRVTSAEPVRLLAIFSSSRPGIFRADGSPSAPPWEGGSPDHLRSDPEAPPVPRGDSSSLA